MLGRGTLEIVGDRWTWLIVRDAFLGIRRFSELRDSLGIAPNVLDERLTRFVDEGIFERVRYNEHPPRDEHRLTPKGDDLFVALNALRQWGDRYVCTRPMRLPRRKSDRAVIAALVPEGSPAFSNELEPVPGPGFPRDAAP